MVGEIIPECRATSVGIRNSDKIQVKIQVSETACNHAGDCYHFGIAVSET